MEESVAIETVLDKLPTSELDEALGEFTSPFTAVLPDKRLRKVVPLVVRGIVCGESPLVTQMARSVSRTESTLWAAAKRIYRFLENERLSAQLLQEGLSERARRTIEEQKPEQRLVVAIDQVNFEKPYTRELEGVSTVHKSTPPNRYGSPRLVRGYPAITATVVNTRVPATTYANWFSYTTEFISENREIYHAIRSTRHILAGRRVRFVADSGLDDQKIFEWIAKEKCEFVVRASHLQRRVEVYNGRLDRWEPESLEDLIASVPISGNWQATFTHAGKSRVATVKVGWLKLRLPGSHQKLWAVVAEEYDATEQATRTLVLLTNVEVEKERKAQEVYGEWRLRARIEHGYRFFQEQGLDVEDMRVQTLERMRRLFVMVLLAMQFVFHLMEGWPAAAVLWLRRLGGKLGLQIDRDGPYLLLRGLSAVWQSVATLSHLAVCPFPHEVFN